MKKIFNIVGFQFSWWCCVLGVKSGLTYLGPFLMLVFLMVHMIRFIDNSSEIKLIILFGILGTLIDTGMAYFGILIYQGTYFADTIMAPLWITAMWCGFSATINHSLSWLRNRYISSAVLGLVFGPLSYVAGAKFGAIEYNATPTIALVTISIVYGIVTPMMYFVNEKFLPNINK